MVNAIVDTLKTAFPRSEPQSPTDDMDAEPDGKLSTDKKSKYGKRAACLLFFWMFIAVNNFLYY